MSDKSDNFKDKKKVIIVDDVEFFLLSTKERFKDEYEIYLAKSSKALTSVLEKVLPDIILLDINMSDVDGFEVIKKLKADKRFRGIPIIFVSNRYDKETLVKCQSLGGSDFMRKPLNDERLTERIEYHLNPKTREESKPVILAVDDNPSILKHLDEVLREQYTVHTLSSPEKYAEVLKFTTPDLFLLDCKMPMMSGFELFNAIRKDEKHFHTPIIFLTADATAFNATSAIVRGVDDYILKPIDDNILLERIAAKLKNYIMGRRIREQIAKGSD